MYFSSFGQWNVHTRFKWEASQGNKRIDGTEVLANPLPRRGSNAKLRSSADLQIVEIDIKEVVDYYNTHKNGNPTDAKFKSAEHIANWLNLKDIKVSNKGKYIKKDQFFTAYTSSFHTQQQVLLNVIFKWDIIIFLHLLEMILVNMVMVDQIKFILEDHF
ncbi:hypothetical protein NWQ34_06145 [Mycoplasmopsis felis]|uniref:hypothetical protein n=1 Tax=Mycoplasmopsis felis TaxID=33923 RepID=UPI0021E0C609|nr:hypothetical protein [Mycoplasmopsis felis]MCU9939119.1 hypothetical protein [Mycoplasmopsis felis]